MSTNGAKDQARNQQTIRDTELGDYIGGYWYSKDEDPRWKRLKDITVEDGEITFITAPCSARSVPQAIREDAYDRYEGKVLLFEPQSQEAEA